MTIVAAIVLFASSYAQEAAARFSVEVSTDSLLMDNPLQVRFTLANGDGQDFEAPLFTGFNVVSGPNVSSSISMMNGAVKQSVSYTYLLMPDQVGNYFIEPASIVVDGKVLETLPLEVVVVPNPDGIRQPLPEQRLGLGGFPDFPAMPESDFFDFDPEQLREQMKEFGFDFDQMELPEFDGEWFDFPGFNWEEFSIPAPAQPAQPKKKKRKTYKL